MALDDQLYRVQTARGTKLAEFVRMATLDDYVRSYGEAEEDDGSRVDVSQYVVVRTVPDHRAGYGGGLQATVHLSAAHCQKARRHCSVCGNSDCPNVDPEPFFAECPGRSVIAPGSTAYWERELGVEIEPPSKHQSNCRFRETPCECIDY